jgi:hypothetical protein
MGYGNREKKIVFHETDNRHAKLKIKLHYDGLKQGEFFRAIVEAYLSDDENMINFISSYKEKNNKQGKRQRAIVAKDREENKNAESIFALNDKEVEDIFDILAEEKEI